MFGIMEALNMVSKTKKNIFEKIIHFFTSAARKLKNVSRVSTFENVVQGSKNEKSDHQFSSNLICLFASVISFYLNKVIKMNLHDKNFNFYSHSLSTMFIYI
jgi:hypothetical protein